MEVGRLATLGLISKMPKKVIHIIIKSLVKGQQHELIRHSELFFESLGA